MCSDCEIALVEELPSATESKVHDNRLHPIRDALCKRIEFIRNNQKATWIFSLLVGVIFYYGYIYAKQIWGRCIFSLIEYLASLIDPAADFNSIKVVLLTIGVNVITDLPAAFIASLFCAALMIYALRKRELHYFLGTVSIFFLFNIRKWHFWKFSDIGVSISSFIGPFLVSFVFILTAWLIIKIKFKNTND